MKRFRLKIILFIYLKDYSSQKKNQEKFIEKGSKIEKHQISRQRAHKMDSHSAE